MWMRNEKIVLREMGFEIDMDLLTKIMGMTFKEEEKMFLERYGPSFDADYYIKTLYEYNDIQIDTEGVPLRPGAVELLEYLKEKEILMAVATSTPRKNAMKVLEKAGILGYFDYIVCGDEIRRSKPNPDIYLNVREHYPIPKEDMVVFEDAHNGARAALSAGIPLILVPDIAFVSEEDKKEAEYVLNSLDEAIKILE